MHTSIRLETPIEIIDITPVNPLISKCQIKVCYVGDTPNRNRTVITKDTAKKIANSLPGSPIVGYYNELNNDYEEHNQKLIISEGKLKLEDDTRPYGFVDLNAKVWFAKYLDDGQVEREYLVTEGWLWTGQYPECKRILENKGNNHSMELDEDTVNGTWTKNKNSKPEFFIINEAIISKLCILGEDFEPCFEGSHITAPEIKFSLEENFERKLFSMMEELTELLNKGGAKVFAKYDVSIGDTLWNALYSYMEQNYPSDEEKVCSIYRIDGVYEEGEQKFAVLLNRSDMKYYRLNFSLSEDEVFTPSETLVEMTEYSIEEPQFNSEDVEKFENKYFSLKNEDKSETENNDKTEDKTEDNDNKNEYSKEEEKCPECGKPVGECTCKKEPEKKYSLEEIPEYSALQTKFSELEEKYNTLISEKEELENTVQSLSQFKAQIEKKEKEAMIESFYMLSEEDKKEVVENIDKYSLDDIEAKLSIICVRNKVNFNLDEEKDSKKESLTYNLNGNEDENMPAWVKRAMSVAKTLK